MHSKKNKHSPLNPFVRLQLSFHGGLNSVQLFGLQLDELDAVPQPVHCNQDTGAGLREMNKTFSN